MEANLDDPPESHDQNKDAEKDVSVVHACPLSKANQSAETAHNDHSDQDDTPSGESGTDNSHTESKSSEKSPCKMQQGAIFSGKILSFCCSECKGDTTYSPNDLLKHFQGAHKGTLPTYPCDLCTFVTNEFSSLQRHRIGHRDTLVTCEICNDGVQYSLLFLTRHFIMCHSCNGLFRCKKCDFSTRDAGTFVQHIHHHNEGSHKCIKCPPLSPTQGKVHSGTFPFTCQFCGYGAARREYLNKHLAVAHGDDVERTNRWRTMEDNAGVNSPGLKLLLKKSPPPAGGSREPQWMTKLNSLPGVGLLDHSGRLFNPEKTLEETQQFLERAVGVKKESNKWSKGPLKSEPQCSFPVTSTPPQTKMQENELSPGSGLLHPSNSNGLTVLMVKNKISIPPNCTTKVMGFKMVDGKKHLVLKVIPTKQEPATKNEMLTSDDTGEDEKTSSSPSSTLSQRSKSFLNVDPRMKKGFTASIKVEAQYTDNFTRDESTLLDEHESNLECNSVDTDQVGDEALLKSSTLFTHPSALPPSVNLESTMTREITSSTNHSDHLGRMSSQPDEELSPSSPTATKSKSTNPTARNPDVSETDISHIDIPMAKPAPSESYTKPTTAVDLDKEQVSQSGSLEDEPTSPEELSNMTSVSILECHALPPAFASNCIADEGTSPNLSDESCSQMDHLEDNNECSDKSTEDSSAFERITEQSSPRSPEKKNAPLISVAEEKQSPGVSIMLVSKTSLSKNTEMIPPNSNFLERKNSLSNSLKGLILPTDFTPSKDLDNIVVNSEFSNITPNGSALSDTSLQHKTCSGKSPDAKDCNTEVETLLQNSPSQEVFSFHNYSKETYGTSPDSLEADEGSPEDFEEDECDDFGELKLAPDWSLTLPASPPLVAAEVEEYVGSGGHSGGGGDDVVSASGKKALERVSDSDIEVDECIATVDDALSIPVLPETEKGAVCLSESEEQGVQGVSSVLEKGTAALSNAAVLGRILEKHSDAIISQQLEKERMVSSATVQDSVRPTKTTLRILQTPEGKQQMFLQTTETPYAVPVQLKSAPGFKLITKSCASKVNVSYVKPGIERSTKGTGLSLTLNGGRIGMSTQGSNGEGKGQSSFLQAVSSSGRYFVNASSLKGPLLLSSALKSPSGEQTNTQPTCYLVQRPLPVAPVSNESTGLNSKTVLTTRPVLAMPVNATDKAAPLQTGRQAYLVRYISPAKSGILLNGSDEKGASQVSQPNEGGKSRVFLKIVRSPNGTRFLSTAPYPSAKKPIYVAAGSLQSPYFLMSPNRSFTNLSAGLKTSSTPHGPSHKIIPAKLKNILPQSSGDVKNRGSDSLVIQKSSLIPMYTRPRSQRKRRRRALFEESFESSPKTRRISSKTIAEKEVASMWEPVAKDVERTLRLSPFSPLQQIKFPRWNQPVVVLNHPDADIPQVASIMKSVNRYKNEVVRVSLSQNTVKALSEWSLLSPEGTLSKQNGSSISVDSRVQPLGSNVRERFILKLKLKKTSRSKYEVVKLSSGTGSEQIPTFSCWFCGRVFNNQEEWIGHGQRHLMEATRDWNKLF